jgi:Transaldolase
VYVKIPITNSKGNFAGKVIKKLNQNKIKLNITAVYTTDQVRKIIENIKSNSRVIISIFAGRMGDAGIDPMPMIRESIHLTKKIKNVEVLWASTREAYNYTQAKNCGCSIITMPPSLIEKVMKFGKSPKELSLDTVKKFLKDSKDSKFKV